MAYYVSKGVITQTNSKTYDVYDDACDTDVVHPIEVILERK